MDNTKIVSADLDSPCREFSVRRLAFAVALLGLLANQFFVCVYWRSNQAVRRNSISSFILSL